jgi:hypothetical protein
VRVEVVRETWENALAVPRGAVRFDEDGPVANSVPRGPQKVSISACTPLDCIVESGLQEGERVAPF